MRLRSGHIVTIGKEIVMDGENKVVNIADSTAKPGRKKDTRKASEKKFGKPVMALGFCIVPSLLMKAQRRLGLNAVQFNILLHLLDFWWEKERLPWPAKKRIAERMNMSERHVQRQIAELEAAGLVERIQRTQPGRGKVSNEYDLSGLVAKLKDFEPEFTEAKTDAAERRAALSKPKHLQAS
jgi:DNA-binding transcriptional ArsR family regulator